MDYRNIAKAINQITTDEVLPDVIAGEHKDRLPNTSEYVAGVLINRDKPLKDVIAEARVKMGYEATPLDIAEAIAKRDLKQDVREQMADRGETFLEDLPEYEWEKLDRTTQERVDEMARVARLKRKEMREDLLWYVAINYESLIKFKEKDATYGLIICADCGKIARLCPTQFRCYEIVLKVKWCPYCRGEVADLMRKYPEGLVFK